MTVSLSQPVPDFSAPATGGTFSLAAQRGKTGYAVEAASVGPTAQHFAQVVEVPQRARNVHFYPAHTELPRKYREALQRIR